MVNYEAMYKVLFNGITDALHDLDELNFGYARDTLVKTQQVAEEIFLETEDDKSVVRLIAPADDGLAAFRRVNK